MFINQLHHGGIRALIAYDSTIFDEMQLPSGVDLQEVVDTIIFKYGDTPLFSPDPSVMKYYIKLWSIHRLPLWERFKSAVEAEYDPLENYNRIEESSTDLTHGHKIVSNDDLKHGENVNTSDNLTHDGNKYSKDDLTHGLTVENQISADNESTYQPDNKGINSGTDSRAIFDSDSASDRRNISEAHDGTDQRDFDETHSGTDKTVNKSHIHGNIGVTTSQQMLASELDLIPKLDVVDYIADDFHSEFCLMIY